MKTLTLMLLALLLTACTGVAAEDTATLLLRATGHGKDRTLWWERDNPIPGPSVPTPAPAWCQSERATWNGFGCSMR